MKKKITLRQAEALFYPQTLGSVLKAQLATVLQQSLSKRELSRLSNSQYILVLLQLLYRADLPVQILAKLSKHYLSLIRSRVLYHANTPQSIIFKLTHDEDVALRLEATWMYLFQYLQHKYKVPSKALYRLFTNLFPGVNNLEMFSIIDTFRQRVKSTATKGAV